MCVQIFHMVNIDVPAGFVAPPLNTQPFYNQASQLPCALHSMGDFTVTSPYLTSSFPIFSANAEPFAVCNMTITKVIILLGLLTIPWVPV